MTHARMKFIVTQATKTNARAHHLLAENESASLASAELESSHLIFTNHPIGSQLSVKFVPYLSVNSFLARGGIPIQNSSTFIFVNLAVRK